MPDDLWSLNARGDDGKKLPSKRAGRGKRWRVRYDDDAGVPRSRLFEREADAKAFEHRVHAGTHVEPAAGSVRLREYADSWLAAQTFNRSTWEAVEARLRLHVYPVLGDLEVRTLEKRPSLIQAWLKGMHGRLSDNTIRPILANLSSILTAALDDGMIGRNPCRLKSVKAPPKARKRIRPWVGEQVQAIHDALSPRYAAMVDVGYGLGLRQGEVFGLAVDDVPWLSRDPVVHVRRQVKIVGGKLVFAPPKFGQERDVPLARVTSARLSAHLQRWPATAITLPWEEPDGRPTAAKLIFTNSRGGAIVRPNFNRDIWQPALIRAGITGAPGREHGFHMLRHTYASTQLHGGTDIRALAEYLGHSDPGFTLREYEHLMPGAEGRARRVVDEAYGDEREERAG
jgi:integrase